MFRQEHGGKMRAEWSGDRRARCLDSDRSQGTATLTFADGNNATFAYTINGSPGSKSITREVFEPSGTVCQ